MYCAQCGTWNDGTSRFCVKCGVALPETPVGIATAESVFAGFWIRVGAYLIDYVILTAAGFVALFLLGFVLQAQPVVAGLMTLVVWIGAPWLYTALFESGSRQGTPGKLAVNLKVTDLTGNPISFGRATGRYFAEWITALTLGVGYAMVAFTDRRQSLHDMLAGTVVVRKEATPEQVAHAPPAKTMPAVAVIAILFACFVPIAGILAAIAIPAYQDYTIRTQVSEGLTIASPLKAGVAAYAAEAGDWPADLASAGGEEVRADVDGSRYVDSIDVTNGTITIVFGGNANPRIAGQSLSLRPFVTEDGDVVWQCGNAAPPPDAYTNWGGEDAMHSDPGGTDLADKHLPASCRSGFTGP